MTTANGSPRVWGARVFAPPGHAPPVRMPALWGRSTDMVLGLIDWVHAHVRKVEPDEQWLKERYVRRSVLEILAEGTTFCLGPCPERTVVASAVLSLNGVGHRLVAHERHVPGTGPPIVHMALELDLDEGPFWLDFTMWETKFIPGAYTFRKDIERTIGLTRIQLPPGDLLLHAKPDDLAHLVPRKESQREAKVEWYVPDLGHIDPRLLEEYVIFSPEASRYERRQIAPRPHRR
ncbi:hypothetical protein [Streptomyces sp. ODS28]|uniref:hypothetical protein n=1 Tax=Streptomyces sp. ODS28 TaxID=3136688 RepID=UPI0031E7CE52